MPVKVCTATAKHHRSPMPPPHGSTLISFSTIPSPSPSFPLFSAFWTPSRSYRLSGVHFQPLEISARMRSGSWSPSTESSLEPFHEIPGIKGPTTLQCGTSLAIFLETILSLAQSCLMHLSKTRVRRDQALLRSTSIKGCITRSPWHFLWSSWQGPAFSNGSTFHPSKDTLRRYLLASIRQLACLRD